MPDPTARGSYAREEDRDAVAAPGGTGAVVEQRIHSGGDTASGEGQRSQARGLAGQGSTSDGAGDEGAVADLVSGRFVGPAFGSEAKLPQEWAEDRQGSRRHLTYGEEPMVTEPEVGRRRRTSRSAAAPLTDR